jgi:protein-tyrosine kinase
VMTLAITLVFVLFGVVAATVLARTSRRVLDGAEAVDLLGVPFAATVPSERSLRARSLHQLQRLPPGYRAVVNELCVQVESRGVLDTPLSVLVTGSQRVSGTTTLAAGIAARFGEVGSKVVLVDLDFDQPDLSKCFGVEGDGLSALVFGRGATGDALDKAAALTPTPLTNVSVVGRQTGFGQARPQRAELLAALDMAAEHANVVVIDAGPMLAAPAAAVLAPHTDAVVLAVPVWSQERASLKVVARQLASVKSHLLSVSMPRLKRSHRLPVSAPATTPAETNEPETLAPTAR